MRIVGFLLFPGRNITTPAASPQSQPDFWLVRLFNQTAQPKGGPASRQTGWAAKQQEAAPCADAQPQAASSTVVVKPFPQKWRQIHSVCRCIPATTLLASLPSQSKLPTDVKTSYQITSHIQVTNNSSPPSHTSAEYPPRPNPLKFCRVEGRCTTAARNPVPKKSLRPPEIGTNPTRLARRCRPVQFFSGHRVLYCLADGIAAPKRLS